MRATLLALLAVVMLSLGALWMSGTPVAALVAAVALILALNRFFFPSRFAVDAHGITAEYLLKKQTMPWSSLRRFVHDQRGGMLSKRRKESWLDAYQGLHILFGSQRERVVAEIKARLLEETESWA